MNKLKNILSVIAFLLGGGVQAATMDGNLNNYGTSSPGHTLTANLSGMTYRLENLLPSRLSGQSLPVARAEHIGHAFDTASPQPVFSANSSKGNSLDSDWTQNSFISKVLEMLSEPGYLALLLILIGILCIIELRRIEQSDQHKKKLAASRQHGEEMNHKTEMKIQ